MKKLNERLRRYKAWRWLMYLAALTLITCSTFQETARFAWKVFALNNATWLDLVRKVEAAHAKGQR